MVETHPAEGQWLEEQMNMVKLPMYRVGTQMPIISRTEEQHLLRTRSQSNNACYAVCSNLIFPHFENICC
jgi:hypothetical protein